MKLSPTEWCKIQKTLADLKCPHCSSARIKLTEDEKGNANCEDCGCKFDFDPDLLFLQQMG